MKELASWLLHPKPTRFPYDVVVGEYHRVGKHFVAEDLLAMLARARDAVDHLHDPFHGSALLHRFLQTALDKWDGRYDYPTYTGLALLPMPSVDDPPEQLPYALPRRDRLVIQLIADLLDFELAASEGRTDVLPRDATGYAHHDQALPPGPQRRRPRAATPRSGRRGHRHRPRGSRSGRCARRCNQSCRRWIGASCS